MPMYEYRCGSCGSVFLDRCQGSTRECACGAVAKRVWGFRVTNYVRGWVDPLSGIEFSDQKKAEHEMRKRSEEATERTGIPHSFTFADWRDVKTLKVTDEGLDATYDHRVRSGKPVGEAWRHL